MSADDFPGVADEVTCQEFVELVTDYFEGTLSRRSLTLVEEHLVMCDWCVTYVDQIRTTLASLHGLRTEPANAPDPSAAVQAALRQRRQAVQ